MRNLQLNKYCILSQFQFILNSFSIFSWLQRARTYGGNYPYSVELHFHFQVYTIIWTKSVMGFHTWTERLLKSFYRTTLTSHFIFWYQWLTEGEFRGRLHSSLLVFYSSKAQQMCWQGEKLSEYIQGVKTSSTHRSSPCCESVTATCSVGPNKEENVVNM